MNSTGLKGSIVGRTSREEERSWGFMKGLSRVQKLTKWYGKEEGQTLAILEAYSRHEGYVRQGFLMAIGGR